MSFMVVLIVNDPDDCPAILDAWEACGTTGVTILESTGLGALRRTGLRDDLPLMPSLRDIFHSQESHHRTLISVVETEQMVDKLVEEARDILGDLDRPHSGFLFVVPVLKAYGLGVKHRK
jgi:nitrogen regulatory protein P-II 1